MSEFTLSQLQKIYRDNQRPGQRLTVKAPERVEIPDTTKVAEEQARRAEQTFAKVSQYLKKQAFQPAAELAGQSPEGMGGMAPSLPGAAPPMDPSMMGGMPPEGAPMDPGMAGGMPPGGVDPNTGLPPGVEMDPATGLIIDTTTGDVFDPNSGQVVGNLNDPNMTGVMSPGIQQAPPVEEPPQEAPQDDTLTKSDFMSAIKELIMAIAPPKKEKTKLTPEEINAKITRLEQINTLIARQLGIQLPPEADDPSMSETEGVAEQKDTLYPHQQPIQGLEATGKAASSGMFPAGFPTDRYKRAANELVISPDAENKLNIMRAQGISRAIQMSTLSKTNK